MDKTRFKVIEGGTRKEPSLFRKGTRIERVTPHKCSQCSDELGYTFDTLTLAWVGAFVNNGHLEGGNVYWACARCGRLFYNQPIP